MTTVDHTPTTHEQRRVNIACLKKNAEKVIADIGPSAPINDNINPVDCLYFAYLGGDDDVIKIVHDCCNARDIPIEWNSCISGAIIGKHSKLIENIINTRDDLIYSRILFWVCSNRDYNLVKLVIKKGNIDENYKCDWCHKFAKDH